MQHPLNITPARLVMDGEEWVTCPSFEQYEVSRRGFIRRKGSDAPLKSRPVNKYGHLGVSLSVNGKVYHRTIHRLVALSFLPEPQPGKNFVCHIDGDPANNSDTNLYWGNGTTNARDRVAHGNQSGGSKLAKEEVLKIREMCAQKIPQSEIAKKFAVSQGIISMINTRKVWPNIL